VEDPPRIDARERAAAGAERVDVETRQRDLGDADGLLPGELRNAALEQRDIRARPAHVERDEVALVEQPRGVSSGGETAGGSRQHGASGQPCGFLDRRHAAV